MINGVIDRFEGTLAVVELDDRSTIEISRKLLPENAREGDVLAIDGQKISIDGDATKERKARVEKLMDELFE